MNQVYLDEPGLRREQVPRQAPLDESDIVVVRSLSEADLPALRAPPPLGTQPRPRGSLQIRYSHHALARALAEGVNGETAALITGYDPSWVSTLKNDPAFNDLIEYYARQKSQIFVDVVERMKILGLSTLDELLRRFEEKPEDFTKREMMDMAKLLLVDGQKSAPSGGTAGPSVAVNVSFVQAEGSGPPRHVGATIDQSGRDAEET